MQHKVEIDFHGRPLSIEVGRMAKQASGSALVQYGETVVLTTAVASQSTRPGIDFFPLTVDYQEKAFAAGKIPGGFFKREGRQGEKEILTSRLIDRPIRPLFAEGYRCETQIIATVLSFDKENDSDTVALLGASAALHVSDIPFLSPIAGVRIGRIGGKFVINPYLSQMSESDLNLLVAGTKDSIVMVEGGARMLSEDIMLDALYAALDALQPLIAMQEELRAKLGKPKREVVVGDIDKAVQKAVEQLALPRIEKAMTFVAKQERHAAISAAHKEAQAAALALFPEQEAVIREVIEEVESRSMRQMIVKQKKRLDGRGVADVRPISCEVEVLPRTHGSALFTRGETQALATTTLGTASDEQRIDALIGEHYRKFMLHYNFPPFSVGETKPLRGPSRRDTGHGALAERALIPVLPDEKAFPYTIRIVSEILESNGSSSMATVCSGSLSLMDAGVPIKAPVAGIAMGLIKEGEDIAVLSDILGDEDHLGDMDFKVAGTSEGVTALQMDIKIHGVTKEIMRQALKQAREGRLHILDVMSKTLNTARGDISAHAPRIVSIKIRQDKIRDIIGPGGKVIRGIVEETGCKIDIEDDGTVFIASSEEAGMKRAIEIIEGITMEAQVGKIYKGKVVRIVDFGAFVEIMPGTDGLLHISQIGPGRVHRVSDVLKEGDEIQVKVLEIDKSGKIRLSRKEAMSETGQPAGGN
ncbi:MAG TPA: polyribonucleotide nucleotidyltransferase [Candidatus Dormibacteraeota bacterium]|nr:polyribonucleotide nucleotidyltransferase [Candidatus Dormibacteraeota bacterium]